jgi:TRAP-type uncharacterized transport system substrate-binding protein
MLTSTQPRYLAGFAALVCALAVSWLALAYVFPPPPSRITMATGVQNGTYEQLGRRYRAILARSGVDITLLRTSGTEESLRLLQDKNSGVAVGFVPGGVSDAASSTDLRSLGRVNYQPFWVFYRSADTWPDFPSLKGKRIAVAPDGTNIRIVFEKLFALSGFGQETEVITLGGPAAIEALAAERVDAIFIAGSPSVPNIQTLMHDPNVRLMDFPRANALDHIFPFLVHLVLPAGTIDFAKDIPPADVNLIGTTNAVLVRDDLHPQIVYLLTQALLQVHADADLFKTAGEFPQQSDPEYAMADGASDFYRNGPTFLNRYLPFWVANYMRRAVALLLAATAVLLPVFGYTPRLYNWFREQRLRKLYRRLRVIEDTLQQPLSMSQAQALHKDIEEIDRASSIVPLRDSDLFFVFKLHLDQTRSRLAARIAETPDRVTNMR